MIERINLAGFDARFESDSDPWGTYTERDEATKRAAILRGLGPGPHARILELASGNGSNSAALADRALALDACDGARAAVCLTARALAGRDHARARRCVLPGRLPRPRYEAVVIAELLYYLDRRAMAMLAAAVGRALDKGGRLVLAHHHIDFDDTAQTSRRIHRRFLAATGRAWYPRYRRRNQRWIIDAGWLGRRRVCAKAGGSCQF